MGPAFHERVQPDLPAGLGYPYYLMATLHAGVGAVALLLALYVVLTAATGIVPLRLRFTR